MFLSNGFCLESLGTMPIAFFLTFTFLFSSFLQKHWGSCWNIMSMARARLWDRLLRRRNSDMLRLWNTVEVIGVAQTEAHVELSYSIVNIYCKAGLT